MAEDSQDTEQARVKAPRPTASHRAAPRGNPGTELTFPDLPRLELDVLLGQLVERAREVVSTQSRLRGLLRANQMITTDLGLPVVLRRIAAAARDLVGARYAALGVLASDGLAEFVHVGMPDDLVERIGDLPRGKGLLGALIDDPAPIRLARLAEHERSSGFPPGHPPMDSFLGVPIRVRDKVFGNLYLTESTRGGFSAEDEELATALAATAGVAIENARLYEAARVRQEWLRASTGITHQLLATELPTASADSGIPDELAPSAGALRLIAESCREVARADLVTVVLPTETVGALRVALAVGTVGVAELAGASIPLDGSLAGRVFRSGVPLRLPRPSALPGSAAVARGLNVGPVLLMPLTGSRRVHGVLSAARTRDGVEFSAEDLDMAVGFANQASVAIELAEARAEQQRAVLLDERDRIAADLHDHVIQRLFATGLSLQSTLASLPTGKSQDTGAVRDRHPGRDDRPDPHQHHPTSRCAHRRADRGTGPDAPGHRRRDRDVGVQAGAAAHRGLRGRPG